MAKVWSNRMLECPSCKSQVINLAQTKTYQQIWQNVPGKGIEAVGMSDVYQGRNVSTITATCDKCGFSWGTLAWELSQLKTKEKHEQS